MKQKVKLPAASCGEEARRRVIIDCDPGVDDALALVLAFHSPELDVKAVTGVNGNVPLSAVFDNIQKVLTLLRPSAIPIIAKGADRPLAGDPVYAYSLHGKSGLGRSKIDRREGEPWWHVSSSHAGDLIANLARQYPKEITLIAIGPLTNLAMGLQRDPEGMRMLKDVLIMGGAVRTGGNVTPFAEFNMFVDPLAAERVFREPWSLTLVPLDVTHHVFLTPGMIEERVRPLHNACSQFVIEATGYHSASQRFQRGRKVFYLHDPLSVGIVLRPKLVRKERLSVTVETREGREYDRVLEAPGKGRGNVDVGLEVNSEAFLELFLSRLGT